MRGLTDLKDLVRFRQPLLFWRPPLLTAAVLTQPGRHGVGPDGVLREGAVAAGPGLQRDGVEPEVLQQVEDGAEPHVLDPALAVGVEGEPEVFCPALEVEGENKIPAASLALSDQEDAVARD